MRTREEDSSFGKKGMRDDSRKKVLGEKRERESSSGRVWPGFDVFEISRSYSVEEFREESGINPLSERESRGRGRY